MGELPPTPCAHPGCRTKCAERYCPEHQRVVNRQYDEGRQTSSRRGYDAAHNRLRVLCFVRDGWCCVDCGWEPNIAEDCRVFGLGPPPVEQVLAELRERFKAGERHLHAEHQIPVEVRPDLRLDLNNLRTRCNICHIAKTNRESGAVKARPVGA